MSTSPPPSAPQLKKQLLRQAVEDNLITRAGEIRQRRPDGSYQMPSRPILSSKWLWLAPIVVVGLILPMVRSELADQGAASQTEIGIVLPDLPPSSPVQALQPTVFAAPEPFDPTVIPLAVRRIVVDPGHGGADDGTTGFGLNEKAMTLDIARRLQDRLSADGFEVYLTREDDRAVSLRERAQTANDLRADLFVSIHINWIAERSVRGLETYFLGATEDPELNELARRENRDSGYSLADMKSLLESIYTGVRQDESRQLATRIQRSLYSSLLRQNPDLKNRGVKTAPFVVLVATEMPAILAEVSCLSNQEEAQLLSRPLYREHIAEALSRGIRTYADEVNQSEAKGS